MWAPDGAWSADSYLFPKEMKAGDLYLAIDVHTHTPTDPEAHWRFSFLHAPEDEAPASLRSASLRGVYPDGLADVVAKGRLAAPSDAAIRAYYLIEAPAFEAILESLRISKTYASASGAEIAPSELKFSVRNKFVLSGFTVACDDDVYSVVARGRAKIVVGPDAVSELTARMWEEFGECVNLS